MTHPCTGCTYSQRRFRSAKPYTWCKRYHRIAEGRCLDYRSKASAIKAGINYLKRISLK